MIKLNFSHFTVIRFLFFLFSSRPLCLHGPPLAFTADEILIAALYCYTIRSDFLFLLLLQLSKRFSVSAFSVALRCRFLFSHYRRVCFGFALFSFCYWFAWGMSCHAIMMSWFELSFHSPLSTLCCSEFTFIFFVVQTFLERPLSQGAVSVRIFKNKFNVVFITTHTLTHAHGHQ